jgi:hypothetical protein
MNANQWIALRTKHSLLKNTVTKSSHQLLYPLFNRVSLAPVTAIDAFLHESTLVQIIDSNIYTNSKHRVNTVAS